MLFAKAHLKATTPKMISGKAQKLGLKDHPLKEEGETESTFEAPPSGEILPLTEDRMRFLESSIDKLAVNGHQTQFHTEEMEEGVEMPDLNLDIIKV